MNITLANLESFQEAIKQASKILKCSNLTERLELADNMRKGVTCDFFQLELGGKNNNNDDDDDDVHDEENADESNSNIAEDNCK